MEVQNSNKILTPSDSIHVVTPVGIHHFRCHLRTPSMLEVQLRLAIYKNKLVWKNIIPGREIFVSDLRINSFPRILYS